MTHQRYFPEYIDMYDYVNKHNIKKWDYRFTFAYGYELIILE